ncbi:MAG: pimeloyl-ACP methyl ester esterase BioH [Colwellia sp.]|nr:pimeloyl-ACP methyl ester esterase BioH [Colwellia sp.]
MAKTLHISTFPQLQSAKQNQKIPLVLIHGWGVNSAVWQPLIDSLPYEFTEMFRLVTVDLPGYGNNVDTEISPYSLANICQHLANTIMQPAIYLGWSLGGLVATEMALNYPDKVLALITVASSPRFLEEIVEQDGVSQHVWSGIKPKVLDAFHQQLQVDTKKTISGFLKIQAMGSPHVRQDIKHISQLVFQYKMADKTTLAQSLTLLATSDYRQQLCSITQPFLRLYGGADSLVPKAVIAQIAKLAEKSAQHIFKQASHAPFISHADDFKQILSNWLMAKASNHFS